MPSYRESARDDCTGCSTCGATVPVRDTGLACRACDARAKTAPARVARRDAARVAPRAHWADLPIGLLAPLLAFPVVWGGCRIVLGALGASDLDFSAKASAALTWSVATLAVAGIAFARRRRRLAMALLLVWLAALLVLGGALLVWTMATAGAIRG